MKICAAQTKPIKGDIPANTENHIKFIHLAVSKDADIIIFPELSLTGYEPEFSSKWATNLTDSRFNEFQKISNAGTITI